jgi:hypothetical protein
MNIFGRFYFKQTHQGNLIGEYCNQNSKEVWSESANKLDQNTSDLFIGKYASTWGESNEAVLCELHISQKPDTKGIYRLIWKNDNKIIFKGEGFIVDNILIGDYQD